MENVAGISSQDGRAETLSSDLIVDTIAGAYFEFVGGGPGKMPVSTFAQAIGKSTQLIYQWRGGETSPTGPDLVMSGFILGPDFLNRVYAVIGMNGIHRVESCSPGVLNVAANMGDTQNHLIRAAADGIIDHQEAAEGATKLRASATQMLEQADQLTDIAERGGSMPVIPGGR